MVKLYVEGGGNTAALKTACRQGFTRFITNARIIKRPRVVACGGREDAYDSFCTAIANGDEAILLVDSETSVAAHYQQGNPEEWLPWQHLKERAGDEWKKPAGAADTDCHLMVQVIESWFLADRATLKNYFAQGFKENQLPAASNAIESVSKVQVYDALAKATRSCKTKDPYGKGDHSFELLAMIDPTVITAKSPWAKRFVDELKKKMGV